MSDVPAEGLLAQVRSFVMRHRLLAAGQRVLVAVSGGRDSMVLLDLLVRLQAELGLAALGVAHVDHGLRPDSEADARWVRQQAETYRLPFLCRQVEVSGKGLSPEAAARVARYQALEEMAVQFAADRVALAHHAGDQAETVLLRLLAGAGVAGLAGMRPRRGRFVRPLLSTDPRSLAAYAHQHHLAWRDDPTNRDLSIPRNRVRHRLLPLLAREFQPAVVTVLGRVATILAGEADLLVRRTRRLARDVVCWQPERAGIPVATLLDLPVADQRRLLQAVYHRLAGNTLPFTAVERVREMACQSSPGCPRGEERANGPGAAGPREPDHAVASAGPGQARRRWVTELPGRWRARVETGWLWLEPVPGADAPPQPDSDCPGRDQPVQGIPGEGEARAPAQGAGPAAGYRHQILSVPGAVRVDAVGLWLRAWPLDERSTRAVREWLLAGEPEQARAVVLGVAEVPVELPPGARRLDLVLVDGGQLRLPLEVRPPARGERMRPLGAVGRRPLQRLYRQATGAGTGFPTAVLGRRREDRGDRGAGGRSTGAWPPLVLSQGEPVWFVGVALADAFRVRATTDRIVVLEAWHLPTRESASGGEELSSQRKMGHVIMRTPLKINKRRRVARRRDLGGPV